MNPFLGQTSEDLATASARLQRVAGARATQPSAQYIKMIEEGRLTDADLEAACGVAGAKFCHNARFIAVAATREAVLEMARLAVADVSA